MSKEQILEEIKSTAKHNGGKPLGVSRFQKETGINPYDWSKYWARFGDAQKEAGFETNQLQGAYTDEFLIKKVIDVIRKLHKFPTYREINVEKHNDPEIPDKKAYARLGSKQQFAQKVIEFSKAKSGYEDIIELAMPVLAEREIEEDSLGSTDSKIVGEVYLFKSGKYYKIGKTNDTVRRGTELRIQLPENLNLVHSIKTDDPSGIESYWHKRFDSKRMNGEWFNLNSSDIKAFKAWRRII